MKMWHVTVCAAMVMATSACGSTAASGGTAGDTASAADTATADDTVAGADAAAGTDAVAGTDVAASCAKPDVAQAADAADPCQTCMATNCETAMKDCIGDTACGPAANDVGKCIGAACGDATKQQACIETAEKASPKAKPMIDCVMAKCKNECMGK